ncbi:LLM class flavin-dependent oxidoreductase [Pseudonocardia alni]|uniref:LLM class flavin-dependent oxidoreductase n=1 Tax=Pseudonocardia alni TaxID=33907 RepID=UPI0033F60E5D
MTVPDPHPPIGVLVHRSTPPERIAGFARAAEDAGFGELWLAEEFLHTAAPVVAAVTLGATRRIPVGIGVVPAAVRHPAVTAMEVATLARAHPGRLVFGIGTGVERWNERMGVRTDRPLSVLRATLTTVRTLLDGAVADVGGDPFLLRSAQLGHPVAPGAVRLVAGAVGPRALELAGEVADGVVLAHLSSPRYVALARERVAAGAARAGRPATGTTLTAFVIHAVDDDRDRARASARSAVGHYLHALAGTALTTVHPIGPELDRIVAHGDPARTTAEIPEEWIDRFAVVGTPGDCAGRIREFLAAGATSVVLSPADPATGPRELTGVLRAFRSAPAGQGRA